MVKPFSGAKPGESSYLVKVSKYVKFKFLDVEFDLLAAVFVVLLAELFYLLIL